MDVRSEIEHIVSWIRDWFRENGTDASAVIGLSGGKDSSITAALLVRALGKERVIGVMMPNGVQSDIRDAEMLAEHLGVKTYTVNIAPIYDAAVKTFSDALSGLPLTEDSRINLAPRIRMSVLYAIAQSLPKGGRVANTCNASEDYIGYSTKYGDAAGDFSPCSHFTVREMILIGEALDLPKELVHKVPSDGLCGKSDEEKIGFTYEVLDRYIENGVCEDASVREKIDRMHSMNLHKLEPIPAYQRNRKKNDRR